MPVTTGELSKHILPSFHCSEKYKHSFLQTSALHATFLDFIERPSFASLATSLRPYSTSMEPYFPPPPWLCRVRGECFLSFIDLKTTSLSTKVSLFSKCIWVCRGEEESKMGNSIMNRAECSSVTHFYYLMPSFPPSSHSSGQEK